MREKAEKRVKEKEDLLKKEKLKNESLEKKIGAKDIEIDKLKLKHLNLLKSKEKEIEMLKRNASKSIEERNEWKLKVKEVERKWEECHKLNVSLMENNQKLEQNILNIQQKSNADHTDHTTRINLLELEVLEKNRLIEKMKAENSKLISDQKQSKETTPQWGKNLVRGLSCTFNPAAVTETVERRKLKLIIRAHQMIPDGFKFAANKQHLTIFSAPRYMNETDNRGAIVRIQANGDFGIIVMKNTKGEGGKYPLNDELTRADDLPNESAKKKSDSAVNAMKLSSSKTKNSPK